MAAQIPRSLAEAIRAYRAQHPGATNAQVRAGLVQLQQLAAAARAKGITTAALAAQLRAIQAAAAAKGLTPQQYVGQMRQLWNGYENWLASGHSGSFAQFVADLRLQQQAQAGAPPPSGLPGWVLPVVIVGGAGAIGVTAVAVTRHPHSRSQIPTGSPRAAALAAAH